MQNDLWLHALPHSKAFSAGLGDMKLEYNANANPGLWDALLALDADAVIVRGRTALVAKEAAIAADVARSFEVVIPYEHAGSAGTMRCLAVLTELPEFRSDTGNVLAAKAAAAGLAAASAVAYVELGMGAEAAARTYKVSLRSVGEVDTTAVSKHYGGGGHRNASSCIVPRETFDSWRVQPPGSGQQQLAQTRVEAVM